MKKNICTIAFMTLLCSPSFSMAVEGDVVAAPAPAVVEAVAEASTVTVIEPAPENGAIAVAVDINQMIADDTQRLRNSKKFEWIGSATQSVSVEKDHPDWGKARVIAAQKAMLAAENQFAKERNQTISSTKVRELYEDANEDIPDFDFAAAGNDNRWLRVYNKTMSLAEGQIDSALADMGVDVTDLKKVPVEQRHLKFKDNFQSSVARQSVASLKGLLTFKTYEGFDEDGEYQVGVLMVLSDKMGHLADSIAKSRGELRPNEKKIGSQALNNLTTMDPKELVPDFGVKRVYDADGYPVIVSFGQWSFNSTTGSTKKISRKRDHAYRQAEALADQAIAEFINSRVNYSDMSKTGENNSETGLVASDNFKKTEEAFNIIDIKNEISKKKSHVTVTGIRQLRRWNVIHPQNDTATVVGVLRYWSPINEKKMREIGKKKTKPQVQHKNAAAVKPAANIKASQERMSLDDF